MKKLYFTISEVSELLNEETHVLRYWEKEIPYLSPKKNRSGNRIYSEKDINTLKVIQHLVREYKMQSDNINKFLNSNRNIKYETLKEKPRLSKEKISKTKKLSNSHLVDIRNILRETINLLRS